MAKSGKPSGKPVVVVKPSDKPVKFGGKGK